MRIEKDLLGEKAVPQTAYYGIHTLRAAENFALTEWPVHRKLIEGIVTVKKAAAEVNGELGYLPMEKAKAIVNAADRVLAGECRDQFIVDALQGGAGTSTHMNINEVLANLAIEISGGQKGEYNTIHPLNHVNLHQSTNDVYPTGLRIASVWLLKGLSEACAELQSSLQKKEAEFSDVIKVGRTEMQDAVPIMLGQEFSAYAQAIARDRWRIYKIEERMRQSNLGGTAIGTGLNAPIKYIYSVNERVRQYAKFGLARAENMIDITQNADVFVEVSGLLKALAVNLGKMASDLRLLSSGPRAGLGEIRLPERQAGSSIMPGKINPIIPEAVNQISFQVMASDLAITMAAQAGQLELNPFLPLIAHHLLHSIEVLTKGVVMLDRLCIQGIVADVSRCSELLENSLVSVTALVPHVGYGQATILAQEAIRSKRTVRQIAEEMNILPADVLIKVLNVKGMTHPGISGRKE